jgi:hypothetical protein
VGLGGKLSFQCLRPSASLRAAGKNRIRKNYFAATIDQDLVTYLEFFQSGHYRGGSAGRVDATRGSKHRGLEHAGEKRKHARFMAIAPNSRQVLIRDV